MAMTTGGGFVLVLEYDMLEGLGNEAVFVLQTHVKMHLRFGSKAVDSYGRDIYS